MSLLSPGEIGERRQEILGKVARAAERAGRDPADVTLLAVTKTHPPDMVRNAVQAGLSLFGENRVAEGIEKIATLRGALPDLTWRLIGPLQTNKAKAALQYFQVVESMDRERLAVRLEALLAAEERTLPVLLEVNLEAEVTKSGARPEDIDGLARICLGLPHLIVRGLMAVPPFSSDPEDARPHFRRLREIRDDLAQRFGRPLPELSMGMSGDFEVAVEEGSTEVRLGTALFGPREAA